MQLDYDTFVKHLQECGLLTADQLQPCLQGVDPQKPARPEQLAQQLLKAGLLTRFQIQNIFYGRAAALKIDSYLVLDKLGEGGMGAVYRAEHKSLHRQVAIKLLSSKVKSPVAMQRFQREVQTLAMLEHPHIVSAYDAGVYGSSLYLVMQYVEGFDLNTVVHERGPLQIREALHCVRQTAEGLAYAHEQGIIHRDIKPNNLLLAKGRQIKILDLGLARPQDPLSPQRDPSLTEPGTLMGTIDYMSPEQALDTSSADERSDIYSLGCTLYFLLTGRVPYSGDSVMSRLLAHREAPIPTLVPYRCNDSDEPHLLTAINDLFQRMVAKTPTDRISSMREVLQAIDFCLSGKGTTKPPKPVLPDNELTSFLSQLGQQRDLSQQHILGASKRGTAPPTRILQSDSSEDGVKPDATHKIAAGAKDTQVLKAPGKATSAPLIQVLNTSREAPKTRSTGNVSRRQGAAILGTLGLLAGALIWFFVSGSKPPAIDDALTPPTAGGGSPVLPNSPDETQRAENAIGEQSSTVSNTNATATDHRDWALQLNGRNSRVMDSFVTYEGQQPLTIEAWAAPREVFYSDRGVVFSNGHVAVGYNASTQEWYAASANPRRPLFSPITRRAPLNPNALTHLAIVFDGQQVSLFVDGQLSGRKPVRQEVWKATAGRRLSIGSQGQSLVFSGIIDEVHVSRSARYQEDFTPPRRPHSDGNTTALYPFDEGHGERIGDIAAESNDTFHRFGKWVLLSENKHAPRSAALSENGIAAPDGEGWIPLFSPGREQAFEIMGPFQSMDDLLLAEGPAMAIFHGEFDNFELEFEWSLTLGSSAGVLYRHPNFPAFPFHLLGLEYHMLDSERHPQGRLPHGKTAALNGLFPPNEDAQARPVGDFNISRIVCQGTRIEHWLNGSLALATDQRSEAYQQASRVAKIPNDIAQRREGAIVLKAKNGSVAFRRIRIRRLDPAGQNPESLNQDAAISLRPITMR